MTAVMTLVSHCKSQNKVCIMKQLVILMRLTGPDDHFIHEIMMTSSNWEHFPRYCRFAGNSRVTGEFPSQRPVTRSFVFFDLRLNKRLNEQSWCRWFEAPSCSLWRHCNATRICHFPSYWQKVQSDTKGYSHLTNPYVVSMIRTSCKSRSRAENEMLPFIHQLAYGIFLATFIHCSAHKIYVYDIQLSSFLRNGISSSSVLRGSALTSMDVFEYTLLWYGGKFPYCSKVSIVLLDNTEYRTLVHALSYGSGHEGGPILLPGLAIIW